jgi:diguanylate cyclase (GGDEF)-like protein
MKLNAPRHWTVRRHLAGIVVAVVVVFVGVGAVFARQTRYNSVHNVRAEAAYLANFAAGLIAESTTVAGQQVGTVAANPAAASLLVDPSTCSLDFALALFPDTHLDLVRPDGTIACSSADLPATGATHAGAAWLTDLPTKPGPVGGMFLDGVTGRQAVAFVAAVEDKGRLLGSVAIVVPTADVAQVIADRYGGPRDYSFAIIDTDQQILLSASKHSASGAPSTASEPMPGYLSESHHIDGTPWDVVAGGDPQIAMASTRSVWLRGGILGGCVLLVLVGSMLVVNRRIARPLRELTGAVGGTGTRLAVALTSIDGPVEIQELAAKFHRVIADRDAYELQLSHQALHDPLTGLANRALLVERLNDALDRADRADAPVAVLFIDIDRFKFVNDSLGHDAGDAVLVEVARRVSELIPSGSTLARFGGDELVVVTEVSEDIDLQGLVDDLLTGIVGPIQTDTAVVRVTASIGIATSTPGRRADDLIRDADNAMYAAKDAGRDRAERFTSHLHHRAAAHLTLATEFRVALERGEMHLEYQPKVALVSGQIVGVEALLRWNHPALGSIPPTTFIPIAEDSDIIIAIGEFVLEEACRQAMLWRHEGFDLTMAVNVSGRQLNEGCLATQVTKALTLSGLPAEMLYLELTETLLMADTVLAQRSLEQLHALGVRISIDDFGTGYSSLSYLHRFPVDELKIDRSFVTELTTSTQRASLVTAMVAMGKALGLEIVAEGVETPEQAARLRTLGCDSAQGYLYARPQHPEAIPALVERVLVRSS